MAFCGLVWLYPQPARGQTGGTPHYLPVMAKGWPSATPTPPPGYLLITEVMYDPYGSEPDGEWIEICNMGNTPVDLSSYKVGDEETMGEMEGMFQFPAGSQLAPGAVAIVANQALAFNDTYGFLPDFELRQSDPNVQDMRKYSAWSGGNVELINNGDEVLLIDAENEIVDGLSWDDSAAVLDPPADGVVESHSLERSPAYRDSNTASDWIDQAHPSPGAVDLRTPTPTATSTPIITLSPPGPLTLLISEVLYDPGAEPEGEWIEIYNYGEIAIFLDGIRVGDEETSGGGEGMLAFPPEVRIDSREVLVVANDSLAFQEQNGYYPDYEMSDSDPLVSDMLRDTDWADGVVNLGNNGDEILLIDQVDWIVDAISWGASRDILDPAIPLVREEHSLERYPPDQDADQAADWRNQLDPAPGEVDMTPPTPTPSSTPVPYQTPIPILVINEIHADPHPTAGDANGDGIVSSQQDEFVEIVNITGAPVDLNGWTLKDTVGVRHVFPEESIVPDHGGIVIFGGGMPVGDFGGSLVQVASGGSLGLNNGGDSISLLDLMASPVVSYTYGLEGGDDQSLTRSPDILGSDPLLKHSLVDGSDGRLYSPGTRLDGGEFGDAIRRRFTTWLLDYLSPLAGGYTRRFPS